LRQYSSSPTFGDFFLARTSIEVPFFARPQSRANRQVRFYFWRKLAPINELGGASGLSAQVAPGFRDCADRNAFVPC
jgi:hypothetical protein